MKTDDSTLYFNKQEYADSLQETHDRFSDIFRIVRAILNGDPSMRSWHARRILEIVKPGFEPTSLSPVLAERLARIHLDRLLQRKVVRRSETIDLGERFAIDRLTLERILRNRNMY